MQILCAQPNSIQRQVCVAKRFSEMTEPARIPGLEIVVCIGQFFGVGLEPTTVSAAFIDRHDVASVLAGLNVSVRPVPASGSHSAKRKWLFNMSKRSRMNGMA